MAQPPDFKGKRALITGSTSGIGLGIAQYFADLGCDIILHGLGDPAYLETVRADIKARGVACHVDSSNLMDGSSAAALIPAVEAAAGPIDILINNAGMQFVAAVVDFPAEKWDAIIALNLTAAFHTTKAVLPGMKMRGFGRIINIASAHGLVASANKSAYVASKHGIVGFTKSVALEIAEAGDITINAICPGYVKTPLVEGQITDQAKAHGIAEADVIRDIILKAQPNKRFVEIAEIAALAALIAGPEGRSFNGSAIPIEGGWTAQ